MMLLLARETLLVDRLLSAAIACDQGNTDLFYILELTLHVINNNNYNTTTTTSNNNNNYCCCCYYCCYYYIYCVTSSCS